MPNPRFYNGLPSIGITNFAGLTNQTPSESVNQTIAFSDVVAWRHKRHNFRFGGDIRRVHADSIGGNNPLGSYTFTGYATANPADQVAGFGGITSGSGFADFLLGLPTQHKHSGRRLNKTYLRENQSTTGTPGRRLPGQVKRDAQLRLALRVLRTVLAKRTTAS